MFLDALSDAWSQMTGTLAYVAQAFGENWRTGLAALLDRPAALFYVVGVFAVLALTFGDLTVGSRSGYQRGRFLSANEKIFLRTLDAALGRNYRAFAQVRLAELTNPVDSANVRLRRRALNAVMAKSVDFVICDVLTLDPVVVIEVDDRSHLLPERRDRDAFVNAVFAEIGLPLVRVKAQRSYSVADRMIPGEKLRQSIGYVIQGHGLFPHWTVARNIPIVPRLLNWDARATHKQLAEPPRLRACRAAKSRFPHEVVRGSEIGPSSCGPIS